MSTHTNPAAALPPVTGGDAALAFTEQSSSMMQQLATAQIQSRYAIAARFPRVIEAVRDDMLKECRRPSFCAPDESKNGSSLAIYRVPRGGGKVSGPTIRFAEMALRAYRNLSVDITPVGEDGQQRIYQVSCTDHETNNFQSEIVNVPRSIERTYAKDTDTVLSSRTNSQGKPVYLIIATEDEFAMKRNALISKAKRNLILAMIPGWLIEECVNEVAATARTKDAEDPDAAKRKLYDAFSGLGVKPTQIMDYFGKKADENFTPAELEDLRGFLAAIREQITTWGDIVAAKRTLDEEPDLMEEIEKLIQASGRTAPLIRRLKANHAGNPEALLAFLRKEAADKANTGGTNVESTASTQAKTEPAAGPAQTQASAPVAEERPEKAEPAVVAGNGVSGTGTATKPASAPAPVANDDKW